MPDVGNISGAEDFPSRRGLSDLSPSLTTIDYLSSFAASPQYDGLAEFVSLDQLESDIFHHLSYYHSPFDPFTAYAYPLKSLSFDLSKAPSSYTEAVARPDASVWRAAMDRKKKSLQDMGAFEEVDLPPGEKTIGLKWVYDHKTDAEGKNIA